jgi:hypothetical protein
MSSEEHALPAPPETPTEPDKSKADSSNGENVEKKVYIPPLGIFWTPIGDEVVCCCPMPRGAAVRLHLAASLAQVRRDASRALAEFRASLLPVEEDEIDAAILIIDQAITHLCEAIALRFTADVSDKHKPPAMQIAGSTEGDCHEGSKQQQQRKKRARRAGDQVVG